MRYLKLFICCCFLFFINGFILAQDWAPVGAEWRYFIEGGEFAVDEYSLLRIEKDTIVAGQACRKFVVYNQLIDQNSNVYLYEGYTYSRNDSVFFWQQDTFLLRYDFSVEIGDTTTLEYYSEGELASFQVQVDDIVPITVGIDNTVLNYYQVKTISGNRAAIYEIIKFYRTNVQSTC